jgi:hypothetical protein
MRKAFDWNRSRIPTLDVEAKRQSRMASLMTSFLLVMRFDLRPSLTAAPISSWALTGTFRVNLSLTRFLCVHCIDLVVSLRLVLVLIV